MFSAIIFATWFLPTPVIPLNDITNGFECWRSKWALKQGLENDCANWETNCKAGTTMRSTICCPNTRRSSSFVISEEIQDWIRETSISYFWNPVWCKAHRNTRASDNWSWKNEQVLFYSFLWCNKNQSKLSIQLTMRGFPWNWFDKRIDLREPAISTDVYSASWKMLKKLLKINNHFEYRY